MQPSTERPSSRQPLPPQPDNSGGGIKGRFGGITSTMGIVILVISLIVSYCMCQLVTVKPSLYNTAISGLQTNINTVSTAQGKDTASITQLQADVKSANTALATANTLISNLDSKISQASTQASSASSSVSGIQSSIATLQTSVSSLQTTIKGFNDAITVLQTQNTTDVATITKLTTQLTADEATIASLQTLIAKDEADIKALQTTTTPTPTTTPVNNGVSIAVTIPQIALNPANSYTNAFNITITNASSKGLYGGQIGFTLQVIGLATGETVNTALAGVPLTNTYLTWRPITWTPPLQASFIGDYSGYVPANSTVTLTIQVKVISSSSNIFINIISPTIGGYTSF